MSEPDWKVFNPAGTWRVVVTKELPGARWLEMLTAAGCRVEVAQGRDVLGDADVRRALGGQVDAVIGQLTERWSESLLRALCAAGGAIYSQYAVGFDNVDVEAATGLGLPVGNTPGVLTETTAAAGRGPYLGRCASHRRGRPLDALRRVSRMVAGPAAGLTAVPSNRRRDRRRAHRDGLRTHDGRGPQDGPRLLRQARQRRARTLRCGVRRLPRRPRRRARAVPAGRLTGDLLGSADVVSIHATLTDETLHLVGAGELGQMKDDAVLVNASRGRLLDEAAWSDTAARIRLFAPVSTSTSVSRPWRPASKSSTTSFSCRTLARRRPGHVRAWRLWHPPTS